MAERRMFAKTIIFSDEFLDMPTSARCLYFSLGMMADDEGFVNNPKSVMRESGACVDDMRLLIEKKFVIAFDDGVVVLKHWRIHNYIRNDRKKDTKYINHLNELFLDENNAYTTNPDSAKSNANGEKLPDVSKMDTVGIPSGRQVVDKMDTQVRIGKDSIGKCREREYIRERETPKEEYQTINPSRRDSFDYDFVPPTIEEIKEYATLKGLTDDAERFFNHYNAVGWVNGNGIRIVNWQSLYAKWLTTNDDRARDSSRKKNGDDGIISHDYSRQEVNSVYTSIDKLDF